jgi:hypothetical protein
LSTTRGWDCVTWRNRAFSWTSYWLIIYLITAVFCVRRRYLIRRQLFCDGKRKKQIQLLADVRRCQSRYFDINYCSILIPKYNTWLWRQDFWRCSRWQLGLPKGSMLLSLPNAVVHDLPVKIELCGNGKNKGRRREDLGNVRDRLKN